MKYTHILMDLDGTVFNFDYAERISFFELCREFDMNADEGMFSFYLEVNRKRWRQYEEGILKKEEILFLRFKDLLDRYSLERNINDMSERFIDLIIKNTKAYDGACDVLKKLGQNYIVDAVTNGTKRAQLGKLRVSGTENLFHHLFISGDIGFPKPSKEFFDAVFEYYKNVPKDKFLLVGDSLTADIKGAVLSGIDSVWVSGGKEFSGDIKPSFTVEKISDIDKLLKEDLK